MSTGRDFTLSSCPVLVVDNESLTELVEPCGADMDALIHIHDDGAEYGVWVADLLRAPACGHSMAEIAKAEQAAILGIEP
jgi:hypothetical protein